ncbi:MAG: spore cortex-lytic enzyme [Clostridia bacterium]
MNLIKKVCLILSICLCLSAIILIPQQVSAEVYKYGSRGTTVKTIQTKLKNWGYLAGSADGVFGYKTATAVKNFQKKNYLTPDGIAGRATLNALGINTSSNSNSSNLSADLNILARCIYGEARGESYIGKVAVAAVIINRVASSKFPNTIAGVIYQPGAFTCVSDGQINIGINDECIKAAEDALNGWDPTYGCTFYYNPKTATSQWIRTKPIITTIGKHVFCA